MALEPDLSAKVAQPLSAAEVVRFMLEAGSAEPVLSDWVMDGA